MVNLFKGEGRGGKGGGGGGWEANIYMYILIS